jgi:hypothetical protein
MDYVTIAFGGTAIIFAAGGLIDKYYEKQMSNMLSNIPNHMRYIGNGPPTNKENKLEIGARE